MDSDEYYRQLALGNVGMILGAPNMVNNLKKFEMPFENIGIMPIPKGPARHVTLVGGYTATVAAGATEDQIDAAIKWLEKVGLSPYIWLNDARFTIIFIVIEMTWQGFASTMFLYYASIQGIDTVLYEAAVLDGCSNFKIFYRIMLPIAMPVVTYVAIVALSVVWSDYFTPYIVLKDVAKMTTPARILMLTIESDKNRLNFIAEKPFEFSALHYSIEQLGATRHTYELTPLDSTELLICYKNRGIGSGSCGPALSEKYQVRDKVIDFEFTIESGMNSKIGF